ncbi:MAG: TRAP transporter permease, partial [Phycisphaeraceae bacterium]
YTVIFTMIHLETLRSGIQATDVAERPPLWRTLLRGMHLNLPFIAILVLLLGLPGWLTEPMGFEIDRRTPSTAATWTIWLTLGVFFVIAMVGPRTAYGLERVKERGGTQRPRSETVGFRGRVHHFLTQSVAAMRDGAMNMIGIACACACCGIIIGVVAQTGLGFKITRIIEELSGGALLPALVMTAAASILLGIGLPTTATYIIMATLTAPAILDIAAPDQVEYALPLLLATHLFVFYYGILADDTPPVGLCAYAAAGIAGSDPVRTGIASFRLDLAAFLLPLVFFFNHELLLIDVTWVEVAWVLPGALTGMVCFAMALQGYAWGRLNWWARVMLLGSAFLLVKPTLWMTVVGVALAGAAILASRGRNATSRVAS